MDEQEPEGTSETPAGPERQSTGKIVADIALREGVSVARGALDRRLKAQGYSKKEIDRIVAGQGFGTRFAAAALARLATRSVPGALAVGGGLIAKALFDRRRKHKRDAPTVDEAGE